MAEKEPLWSQFDLDAVEAVTCHAVHGVGKDSRGDVTGERQGFKPAPAYLAGDL